MELGVVLVALAVAVAGWVRAASQRDNLTVELGKSARKVRTLEEFYMSVTGSHAVFNQEFKLVRRNSTR